MMRNVFKVFAVFVVVISVAMMGVAVSTNLVTPDVRSEMGTPAMKNYLFEATTGETPSWKVTRRFSVDPANADERGTVGTYASPYEALIKAHQDLKQQESGKASQMTTEATSLRTAATAFLATQEQDTLALTDRIAALNQASASLQQTVDANSQKLQGLSVKSREIRDETAERRTDVLRLRHELEEMRTDLFRLNAIRRDLTDRLLRLQIENHELDARRTQLEQNVSTPVAPPAPEKKYEEDSK